MNSSVRFDTVIPSSDSLQQLPQDVFSIWTSYPAAPADHTVLLRLGGFTDVCRIVPDAFTLHGIDVQGYLVLPLHDAQQRLTGLAYLPHNPDGKPIYCSDQPNDNGYHPCGGVLLNTDRLAHGQHVYVVSDPTTGFMLAKALLPVVVSLTPEQWRGSTPKAAMNLRYQVQAWSAAGQAVIVPVELKDLRKYQDWLSDTGVTVVGIEGMNSPSFYQPLELADLIKAVLPTAGTDTWGEPLPLGGVEPPATVYPVEAFPAIARDAIEAIAWHVQAPMGLAGQCVLGTMAYIAQIHVNAPDRHKPEGMPCSLFILSEGASGDRKSACHDLADKVIKERERLMQKEYSDDLKAYFSASHDPKDKPQQPRNPRAIFTDATIESIVSAFVCGDITNGAWISDEGGHFFGGATMKGDTMKNALSVLVKFFDKGIADRARSKSNENGSGTVYDVRLMFNLLGQREVLREALTDPLLRGQGFLPRFIFAASQSLAGDRPESRETLNRKTYADPRLQRFWQHVGSLLPDPTDPISMQQFREIEANPRPVLELDDAAIDVWLDFYNLTERLQKAEGKYEYMRAFAGRSGELARRVAAVFACFEQKTLIDEAAMRGACAVVQYSLDEWLRYADATQVSVVDQQAQRLETWLISECKKHRVTSLSRVHVMQFCPITALRKAKALNSALKPLCDAQRVKPEIQGRKQMIAVNPDLFV